MDVIQVHDLLNIKEDNSILSLLKNEKLYYSDVIKKINHYGLSQERSIILTDAALYNMKKKDMEIEEERIATNQENQELNFHNLKLLIFLFNKFYDTKYEYMDYLKKTIVEDKKQNQQLYEDKITLMNDIFMIRHKTLKLENKFKNYLNDKYFLLSVKNHSFKLDKFTQEDQEDYKNDLNKLDILNFMLKVTAQECDTKENDNEKEPKK